MSVTYYLQAELGTCESAIVSVDVTVDQPPTAPTSISGTTTINCGDQTTLTLSGGSDGSGATYEWYTDGCGVGSSIGSTASITVSPTTTTTYYVRRVGSSACTNATACASVTVTVNPTSPPTASDETICSGETATLTASGAPTGGGYNWYSDASGSNLIGTGSTYTTPTLTSNTTYYVQGTAPAQTLSSSTAGGNGCGGGVMFDLTTNSSNLTISSFDLIPNITGNQTVNVYYKSGSYVGSELVAGDWTLLGAYTINGTNGASLNMPVDPLELSSNSTFGIFLNYSAQYTSGANTYLSLIHI